jgi:hypothetical protein
MVLLICWSEHGSIQFPTVTTQFYNYSYPISNGTSTSKLSWRHESREEKKWNGVVILKNNDKNLTDIFLMVQGFWHLLQSAMLPKFCFQSHARKNSVRVRGTQMKYAIKILKPVRSYQLCM